MQTQNQRDAGRGRAPGRPQSRPHWGAIPAPGGARSGALSKQGERGTLRPSFKPSVRTHGNRGTAFGERPGTHSCQYAGVARTIGVNVEFLTPEDVRELWPLAVTDGLVGAIRHPDDGYIQPAELTQALARGARQRGAAIHRRTCVTGIERTPAGEWLVRTDRGDWIAEHVVSATGNFARRTGAMVGLDIPVLPVQHQYIVTEAHDGILDRHRQGLPEMGVLRESDGSWYMREEAGGLLLGPYEQGAPACYLDGPHPQSEYELFNGDVDLSNPLYADGGEMVGRTTGGNYGFRLDQSLALAMVRPEHAVEGTAFDIEILGERYPARVVPESPWDPGNARLRG